MENGTGKGKIKNLMRKCNGCYVSRDEKKLFFCSNCKSQAYCSKECQKADWKNHKPICQNNHMLASRLKAHESTPEGILDRFLLVDGVSLYELDQRLERWVKFHKTSLMAATLQALRLPGAPTLARTRTHVLYVRLEPRPAAEHGGQPAKFFRVIEAEELAVEDDEGTLLMQESPWPESIAQLRGLAAEMEAQGRGTVAAAMIECAPLAVQTVPFGSLTPSAMRGERLYEGWKELLIGHVEQGVKPRLVRARAGGQ